MEHWLARLAVGSSGLGTNLLFGGEPSGEFGRSTHSSSSPKGCPVARQYRPQLRPIAFIPGVHVVAVLYYVVAVELPLTLVLDELAVGVRVPAYRQLGVERAGQGEHGLADLAVQGDPLHGLLDPIGALLVTVLGVAARLGITVLLAERGSSLLLAVISWIEL